MELHCPNCHSTIPAADINIQEMAAKCGRCQQVFFFDRDGLKPVSSRQEPKAAIELPDGMKVSRLLGELEISYVWRRSASGFLTFFAIFWNLMLLPFVAIAIWQGEYVILLFCGLHLLIGVGLLYYTLATFLNTTFVTVTPSELHIQHRPLPSPFHRNRILSSRQIAQLFIKKYANGRTNGQPNWAFAVEALLQNQANVRLVGGLKTADFALYLEQEIERFLHIEDRKVAEEWEGHYS